MKIVATTSLPAVDRPNADRWNAARSRQYVLLYPGYHEYYRAVVVYTQCWIVGSQWDVSWGNISTAYYIVYDWMLYLHDMIYNSEALHMNYYAIFSFQ